MRGLYILFSLAIAIALIDAKSIKKGKWLQPDLHKPILSADTKFFKFQAECKQELAQNLLGGFKKSADNRCV